MRLNTLSFAPDCDGGSGVFRIVHPFHPWHGRKFSLVTCRLNWGEQRVYFHNDHERLVSVPLSWTSLAPVDPFVAISSGRAAFRVEDLLELTEFLSVAGSQQP